MSGPVLVVEDDPAIGETMLELLQDEGYRVQWARNGQEALDLLAAMEPPCLIFLDLMMPVMNGWQLLDALRHDTVLAPTPVVITTAAPNPPSGARRLIRKPYNLERVLEVAREFCGGHG